MNKKVKKHLFNVLFVLFLLALTVFILLKSNEELSWADVRSFFSGCNAWYIAAAVGCMFVFLIAEAFSLKNIARKFGYAQAHVSRVFHRYTNTGLPRYVNRLRLNYIETRRRNDPSASLTDLIFDAGFKSIPTYYRARSQDPPIVTR